MPSSDRASSNSLRFFAACLVLGLALRAVLAWVLLSDSALLSAADQRIYLDLAELLRGGSGLSGVLGNLFGPAFGTERMPVYPVFLALSQAVTGSVYVGPIILQNLLGGLAVWACWKLGELFSPDAANLAGGLAAVNLNMAVYANQMLTESLYLPLVAWCLFWLCRHAMRGGAGDLVRLSLGLGASVLVRSASMYLPLFLVPWLALRPGGGPWLRRAGQGLLFLVLFLAAMSPWVVRNAVVYGHAAVTGQGEPHLVGWIVPSVARFEEGMDQAAAVAKYTARWQEHVAALPEAERADPFARVAEAERFTLDYLLSASPLSVARGWFWGAVRNLFVPVAVELAYVMDMRWSHFSDTPGAGALEQAWNFLARNANPAYALFLTAGLALTLGLRLVQAAGAVCLWRDRGGRAALMALAVVAAYYLVLSGPVGYAKYRLPYEPAFVLLTAVALARLRFFSTGGEGGNA